MCLLVAGRAHGSPPANGRQRATSTRRWASETAVKAIDALRDLRRGRARRPPPSGERKTIARAAEAQLVALLQALAPAHALAVDVGAVARQAVVGDRPATRPRARARRARARRARPSPATRSTPSPRPMVSRSPSAGSRTSCCVWAPSRSSRNGTPSRSARMRSCISTGEAGCGFRASWASWTRSALPTLHRPRSGARAGLRVQARHRHRGVELGGAGPAVDALDRRHVGVGAAVADLDVGLPRQPAVGRVGADPDRLAALAAAGQQRLEPGVGVDLDRVRAAVARAPPTGSRRRSARRSRGGAGAPARGARSPGRRPAPASSRSCDRRADVGRAPAVLEAVGDQLAQQPQRRQRASCAREASRSSSSAPFSGSSSPASRNSPPAAS